MQNFSKIVITAIITFFLTCMLMNAISTDTSPTELSANDNYVLCHYCDGSAPEEYMYHLDGNLVCPTCVYSAYNDVLLDDVGKCHECGDFFYTDDAFGLGLCYHCGKPQLTDCTFCGKTMYAWNHSGIFHVCPSCLGEAYNTTNIEDILIDFNEHRN